LETRKASPRSENPHRIPLHKSSTFAALGPTSWYLIARYHFHLRSITIDGEVIGDEVNLQPDPFSLVEAATELIELGFQVLPYCTEDWVLCK